MTCCCEKNFQGFSSETLNMYMHECLGNHQNDSTEDGLDGMMH